VVGVAHRPAWVALIPLTLVMVGCGVARQETVFPAPGGEVSLVETYITGGGAAGWANKDWRLRFRNAPGADMPLAFSEITEDAAMKWLDPWTVEVCIPGGPPPPPRLERVELDIPSGSKTLRVFYEC
jgi:hypothetical protein